MPACWCLVFIVRHRQSDNVAIRYCRRCGYRDTIRCAPGPRKRDTMSARPWLCPESRCTPLLNCRDGEYEDLTVSEPGHSFTCWGRMAEPVTFIYDGVDHTNDCNACHYTPLKGLIRWQENPSDWETLASYYSIAAKKARSAAAPDPAP